MAVYERYIGEDFAPVFSNEVSAFAKQIKSLITRFDKSLTFSMKNNKDYVVFYFSCEERSFRNRNKDRVKFRGFMVDFWKESGYISNVNLVNDTIIDPSKPAKDYDSAPPFLYYGTIRTLGEIIPYRHRNARGISSFKSAFKLGTELSDIDFSEYVEDVYEKKLREE